MPFQNRVLEKLFKGVLQNESVEFSHDLIDRSRIDQAVNDLPMPLSERQKDALYNAWQNEISYIQGPPGTGKSYTIVAIMLSALSLRKKVLLVSQKKAAIDVVRRKLEEFLGENCVIYVGAESQDRKKLQSFIEEKLAEVNAHNFEDKIERRKKDIGRLYEEIESQKKDLSRYINELKEYLDSENRFYQENKKYLEKRDNFSAVFGEDDAKQIHLKEDRINDSVAAWLTENIKKFKQICSLESHPKRKDIIYMRRFYKRCIQELNADKDRFPRDRTQRVDLYLELLLNLNRFYAEALAWERKVNPDLTQIRKVIQQTENDLLAKKKDHIKQWVEQKFIIKLEDCKNIADEFKKLLKWTNENKILEAMRGIDYPQLTTIFPLWAGEIKDLGRFLPFQAEMFDLVIVDEASQVNIAEIIPAFYRGKSFCVVGDEKQLGLNAAGLFALNRKFETLSWNRYFAGLNPTISYERAQEKALIVSKSSILDLIINEDNHFRIPKVTLNEHFRSMPQLARFTSQTFYDDNLLIMTEVGRNVNKVCFEAIRTGGERQSNAKLVPEEIDQLIETLKALICENSYLQPPLDQHGFSHRNKPTIGVLSFLTQQRDAIRARLQEEFDAEEWNTYQLFVGTPEEFQGNERNIIIITLGLDGSNRWAKGHYENPNRLNVATSRAINYTYLIYGGMPSTADLLRRYLRHFGYQVSQDSLVEPPVEPETVLDNRLNWKFDESKLESEFEFKVLEYLRDFVQHYDADHLKLYNQVESCKKRLDFVIFNANNQECCAIEVDGVHHFTDSGSYSESHLTRIEILQRAGWKIVHVPYHKWYKKGWLCDRDDSEFCQTIEALYNDLRSALAIAPQSISSNITLTN